MTPARERALSEAHRIIRRVLGDRCAEIYLFGSYARGTPRQSSDIDIAVLAETPLDQEISRIRDALEDSDIPFEFDVVDLSRVDPAFRQRVLREALPWRR